MLVRCAFIDIPVLICIIVINSPSMRAARLFRSTDDGEDEFKFDKIPQLLDARAAREGKLKNLVDDSVYTRDSESNCGVQVAKTNKVESIFSKALKSRSVYSRKKRSDIQNNKSKRSRSPKHSVHNEVLVPYVPLNLYTYQHQNEYVVLDEVIFEEEPKYDPEISDEPKYDPVIVDEDPKYDLVIYEEEPKYDPNDDLRLIFDSIDAKFKEKIEKKKKVKNSIVKKWLEILSKKREALFWLWKKKFSMKGFTNGILYAEEIRYPKNSKDTTKHYTRPSSPKYTLSAPVPKMSRKLVRTPDHRKK